MFGRWTAIFLAEGLLFLFLLLVVLDACFAQKGWNTIGYRIREWMTLHPFYHVVFVGVLGAILGHFFAK